MLKLHLGCGRKYLPGYVNIDFPVEEQSIQLDLRADIYVDLRELNVEHATIDEIRIHHVFEHFPRPVALALLCKWSDWLKPGGLLIVETPDLMSSAWLLVSPFHTFARKMEVVRHLFGSHEAAWAAHWDGWFARRFSKTFKRIGYRRLRFKRTRWAMLRNIEAHAMRDDHRFSIEDYRQEVERILSDSLVKHRSWRNLLPLRTGESERDMLRIWMTEWERFYQSGNPVADLSQWAH